MTVSMSGVLRRARDAELRERWPQGAHVSRVRHLAEPVEGRVAFIDDGWIYWAAVDGRVHASRPDALRRT